MMIRTILIFCILICSHLLFAQQVSIASANIGQNFSASIGQDSAAKISYPSKADQKILNNRNIFSFKDLMRYFKGKKVFVDLWATWCGPCKEQFAYNHGLKEYLKANGVEMLYISMDNLKADKQWRKMIRYYGLSGTHIRAADALKKDLMNLFWDGKSYSIPRYLIVDDGVVVEKSALRPSDGQKLYDQIGK